MRFLAAWFSDPVEYWPNLIGLIVIVALGAFIIRKIQAKSKAPK
jgi:hypothetical protein